MWPRQHAEAQTEHQNGGKKWTLWLLVPDRVVWVSTWAVTQQKSNYPASSSCVDENALLVWDVRGGRADYFQTIQQPRNSIYHRWTHNQPNLEEKGLRQRPHQSHSCQLRTGTGGNNSSLASVVQAASGGVMVLDILPWHTWGPL